MKEICLASILVWLSLRTWQTWMYVGCGSGSGSIQPKARVSQRRMQNAKYAGEGGEAVNRKRECLSRKGGGVQRNEWHLHHNPTRTSSGIYISNETANQSTDEAINEVPLGDEDVVVCMTGPLVPFGLETDETCIIKLCCRQNRVSASSLATPVYTPVWNPIHIPYKTGFPPHKGWMFSKNEDQMKQTKHLVIRLPTVSGQSFIHIILNCRYFNIILAPGSKA